MEQDETREEINLSEEKGGRNVSYCLQYFTACYNNVQGRPDLKHAEKTLCFRVCVTVRSA